MNFLEWITCCGSDKVENEDQRNQVYEPIISPRMEIEKKPAREQIEERGEGTIQFYRPQEGYHSKLRTTKKVTQSPHTRFEPKREAVLMVDPGVQQQQVDEVSEENKSFCNSMHSLEKS